MPPLAFRVRDFLLPFIVSIVLSPAAAQAQQQAQPPQADPAQLESVIATLEDPAARDKLVADLKVLLAAQQQTEQAKPAASSAVAALLQTVSRRMAAFGGGLVTLTEGVSRLPAAAQALVDRALDEDGRAELQGMIIDLASAIIAAYVALWLVGRVLAPARKPLHNRKPVGIVGRILQPVGALVLDLLPVAAFGGAGYVTLSVIDPQESPRLVALAWLNAGIAARVVMAVGRALFAARSANVRLLPMSDENAGYGEVWLRRLATTGIYGFFALQAALLLGLPREAYTALLRLLGLVMAGLLVVLVLQTRGAMARLLRGNGDQGGSVLALRERAAKLWHLVAIFYVLVLYGVWAFAVPGGFMYIVRGTALSVVVLIVARLALRMVNGYFKGGMRVPEELQRRFPGIDKRGNRYLNVVQTSARLVVTGLAVLAVLQAWNLDALTWLVSDDGQALGQMVGRVLAIVVISALAWEFASTMIESWLAERTFADGTRAGPSARAKTLLWVGRNALLIVIITVSTLMVLSELGINIGPMLAGAGVLGLAIGFGSQKLVNDVVTGVFILIENLIEVGDVVTVGGQTGVCEAINIRNVRLRALDGTVHTIPYSSIDTVSNLTRDFSYYVIDAGVAYREDTDQVVEVLKQLGEELQKEPEHARNLLGPLEVLGVQALADSSVVVRARLKTLPGMQWATGREFNRRMKKRFDELGIEIPFPHQTVYFGVDKDGSAPPARLRMEAEALDRQAPAPSPTDDGHDGKPSASAAQAPPTTEDAESPGRG